MATIEQTITKYIVTVTYSEEDCGYVARFNELGYAVRGVGKTRADAIADLELLTIDALFGLEDVPMPFSEPSRQLYDDYGP